MARILLTGGNGLVGRNFLEHPRVSEHEVYAPGSKDLNLLNYSDVSKYIDDTAPDIVVHAAGIVGGIQANVKNPVRFLVHNLDIGRNIVLASREAGIKKLLNLGSSCMYPRNAPNPLTEDMILTGELEPTNEGYALAKIVTARLCQYISQEDPEYQYKTLIPCNIYGRFDKFDPERSHLIPAIIYKIHKAVTEGVDKVVIWGDGTARREFMYAGDLADCMIKAVNEYESMPCTMNVGIGTDHSINEYYNAVADVLGYTGKFVHDKTKPVGMAQKLVSTSLSDSWGWHHGTTLLDGISRTFQYYQTIVE